MPQNSSRYCVLLVDDDAPVREVVRVMLEAKGYEVITAADGVEALLALEQSSPHIIISDLSMPKMDGYEFLSVVRRRFPSIPVIVLSAEFTEHSCPDSVMTDAYFAKGQYAPDALMKTVLKLICELPSRVVAEPLEEAGIAQTK